MEILVTITRESEWLTLFSTPTETQELLNFLVSLSSQSTSQAKGPANQSNSALKAA